MDRRDREHVDGAIARAIAKGAAVYDDIYALAAEVLALRELMERPVGYSLQHEEIRVLKAEIAKLREELAARPAASVSVIPLNPSHAEAANRMAADLPADLDNVAALVKAARGVPENMAILRLSDRDKEVSELLHEIHKALELFEGE